MTHFSWRFLKSEHFVLTKRFLFRGPVTHQPPHSASFAKEERIFPQNKRSFFQQKKVPINSTGICLWPYEYIRTYVRTYVLLTWYSFFLVLWAGYCSHRIVKITGRLLTRYTVVTSKESRRLAMKPQSGGESGGEAASHRPPRAGSWLLWPYTGRQKRIDC